MSEPAGDIVDMMIAAWNDPFATDHDPRELLVAGAREIHRLRRELAARGAVIRAIHEASVQMSEELRAKRPDPNAAIYLVGLGMIAVVMLAIWMLVGS